MQSAEVGIRRYIQWAALFLCGMEEGLNAFTGVYYKFSSYACG